MAWRASSAEPLGLGAYAGVAAAGILLLNVLVPHLLVTLWFRLYAPGTVTAVVINSWLAPMVIVAAIREGRASPRGSVLATLIGGSIVAASLPLAFIVGGAISRVMAGAAS